MPVDPDVAHHRAKVAANARWSRRGARQEQSRKLSEARLAYYERQVDPDGTLPAKERAKLARNALEADMARLSLASAKARRKQGGGPDGQAA
jgi:hypothetical protein